MKLSTGPEVLPRCAAEFCCSMGVVQGWPKKEHMCSVNQVKVHKEFKTCRCCIYHFEGVLFVCHIWENALVSVQPHEESWHDCHRFSSSLLEDTQPQRHTPQPCKPDLYTSWQNEIFFFFCCWDYSRRMLMSCVSAMHGHTLHFCISPLRKIQRKKHQLLSFTCWAEHIPLGQT